MKPISRQLTFEHYESIKELSQPEQSLVEAARNSSVSSYAPYSNFQVGAAVLLEDGSIISGSNQENVAYPSGLCAERVALFQAQSQHPDKGITAIAIAAQSTSFDFKDIITPCGACRQVMAEYEERHGKPLRVLMTSANGTVIAANGMDSLLPLRFRAEPLRKKIGLEG